MGVDCYMTWEGFGERKQGNPNYDAQITGFADAGDKGYLRIAYSDSCYDAWSSCLCWNWDKNVFLTEEILEKFDKEIKEIADDIYGDDEESINYTKSKKLNWLGFSELARKLIKEGKKPKVYISY